MEEYERFYYGYQTIGRGATSVEALQNRLEAHTFIYDELLKGHLDQVAPGLAIDLGCGYGNFLYYLRARHWADAAGYDLTEGQVALAQSLGLNAQLGDARQALDSQQDVSLVAAFDLIEHLSKNDAVALLRQSHQVLKDGGLMIVQCPCADGFRGAHDFCNDLTHRWAPTSNTLSQMLGAAGFSRVTLIDLTLPPFPRTLRSRIRNFVRRMAGLAAKPALAALGVGTPKIWSNSMIALGWKLSLRDIEPIHAT